MPKRPAHPLLQVLFEPFPSPTADGYTWNRDGGEAFAGTYYLDALDDTGALKVRGYRVTLEGCSGCRRSDTDPRVHWDMRNDNPGPFAPKKATRCGKWRMIESIMKHFGGWNRVHYIELAAHEGLSWQPIPQRRRVIEKCGVCGGTALGKLNLESKPGHLYDKCEAGCGSYTHGGRGEVQITYEGPVRPDRHGMSAEQRRKRRACAHRQCPPDACLGC